MMSTSLDAQLNVVAVGTACGRVEYAASMAKVTGTQWDWSCWQEPDHTSLEVRAWGLGLYHMKNRRVTGRQGGCIKQRCGLCLEKNLLAAEWRMAEKAKDRCVCWVDGHLIFLLRYDGPAGHAAEYEMCRWLHIFPAQWSLRKVSLVVVH